MTSVRVLFGTVIAGKLGTTSALYRSLRELLLRAIYDRKTTPMRYSSPGTRVTESDCGIFQRMISRS
ncbi:MAG: hypothetical protein GKB99_02055 [Methanocellales archaeon]|nr:hypothetical protein [Methanocellales archaeon]